MSDIPDTKPEIPKESRLQKYLNDMPSIDSILQDLDKLYSFLKGVFNDCVKFIRQETNLELPFAISLNLIGTSKEYKVLEEYRGKAAIIREDAKIQSYAFCAGNNYRTDIYVDLQYFLNMWKHGSATLLFNLAATYIHEIIHACSHQKGEQEVYDLGCQLLERFLGIRLSTKMKELRASDYYRTN